MVNYHFKNELIRNGFKTYLSIVNDSDYNLLPDEIIEKIMKYVNESNMIIISNMNLSTKYDFELSQRNRHRKDCIHCLCSVRHSYSKPCPLVYLNPKSPQYITNKYKRIELINKIKSGNVKRWTWHNVIITDDNEVLNPNVSLRIITDKNKNDSFKKCICGSNDPYSCKRKTYHNRHFGVFLNGYDPHNIKYQINHNLLICKMIENEKVLDNVFKLL